MCMYMYIYIYIYICMTRYSGGRLHESGDTTVLEELTALNARASVAPRGGFESCAANPGIQKIHA